MGKKNKRSIPKIVQRWHRYWDDDNDDLEMWQQLCGDLGLDDDLPSKTQCKKVKDTKDQAVAPSSLPRCAGTQDISVLIIAPGLVVKQALRKVHVNIFDFLDSRATGKPPRTFSNAHLLAEYSRENQRCFPKSFVKEGGPLRALLRHIF